MPLDFTVLSHKQAIGLRRNFMKRIQSIYDYSVMGHVKFHEGDIRLREVIAL